MVVFCRRNGPTRGQCIVPCNFECNAIKCIDVMYLYGAHCHHPTRTPRRKFGTRRAPIFPRQSSGEAVKELATKMMHLLQEWALRGSTRYSGARTRTLLTDCGKTRLCRVFPLAKSGRMRLAPKSARLAMLTSAPISFCRCPCFIAW